MFHTNGNKTFGTYLKTVRKRLKLTQSDIREAVGVNEDTLRKLEAGLVIPKYETLSILSRLYKIDLVLKYCQHRYDNSMLTLYATVDDCLLRYDTEKLSQVSAYLATPEHFDAIEEKLLNPHELEQFKIYIETILSLWNDTPKLYPTYIARLELALQLTIPKFSSNSFSKHIYSAFELRLLMLYALLWSKEKQSELSNSIYEFVLTWLDDLFADELIAAQYYIKAQFNMSYNDHIADRYEQSLHHADLGIAKARKHALFNDVYGLYFRKFTAERFLNIPTALDSLRKCFTVMELLGNDDLLKTYKAVVQKQYGIDPESVMTSKPL